MKYKRFIDASGGWSRYQGLLDTLDRAARKNRVSVSNVATAWFLGQRAVASVIVGVRLGENDHRDDNRSMHGDALDEDDLARISAATEALDPIPGDCGDEYRKPPFLTASGDLSHHLGELPPLFPTPVTLLEIPRQAPQHPPQHMARQMRTAHRGADQESAQAHHPVEMIPALLLAPRDPTVARPNS